ncbi:MAG: hypothetical protein R3C26_14310 [Calditrichia bacterium]
MDQKIPIPGSGRTRIFSEILLIIAVSFIAIAGVALWIANEPLPEGVENAMADSLAREMMAAVNIEKWQQTGAISAVICRTTCPLLGSLETAFGAGGLGAARLCWWISICKAVSRLLTENCSTGTIRKRWNWCKSLGILVQRQLLAESHRKII